MIPPFIVLTQGGLADYEGVDWSATEPHIAHQRKLSGETGAYDYVLAARTLELLSRQEVARWGRDFDVLLTPTSAILPPQAGAILAAQHATPEAPVLDVVASVSFTAFGNVTGLPAISLPLHRTDDGRSRRRAAHRRAVGRGDADPPVRAARAGAAVGRPPPGAERHRLDPWPSSRSSTEVAEGILTITLNRPERLNAWTATMGRELIEAFDQADADDEVRAIVMTGAGRGYCAGADLAAGGETFDYRARAEEASLLSQSGGDVPRDNGGQFTLRIFASTKPVIGAINGPAVGVGATMTLPMDVRLAADDARMGFVFARRGIVPEACSSWFLPRVVGHQPRDGVGLHRPRVLRAGGPRRGAVSQPAQRRRAAAGRARAGARDRRQHRAGVRSRSRAR